MCVQNSLCNVTLNDSRSMAAVKRKDADQKPKELRDMFNCK